MNNYIAGIFLCRYSKNILRSIIVMMCFVPALCFADNKSLVMVGEANLKVLFWSVYNSRLYTSNGVYDKKHKPIKLEIEYLRNIKAKDLVGRTASEWDYLGLDEKVYKKWIIQLTGIWPDIRKGDVLAIYLDENNKSRFYFNNSLLATIEDKTFGENFLAIWLSPDTSQPEHRLALIGDVK